MLGNNCWYVVYELLRLLRNLHYNVAAAAAAKIDSRCTRPVAVESLRRAVAVAVGAVVALKIGSLDARLVTSNIARDDRDRPCPLLRNGCKLLLLLRNSHHNVAVAAAAG